MKRAFVTGHLGFTGTHLVRHLGDSGYLVAGFDRADGGDIRDADAVARVVDDVRPDVVFHLAGVLKSTDPREFYSVNVLGTVTLLDALRRLSTRPIVVIVSSSAVYGPSHGREPISEHHPLRPWTHYGASKLAQEQAARRFNDTHELPVLCVRPFNLLGPALPTSLACGSFAASVARLERQSEDRCLSTGNLNSSRDFTDVRDVVRAYRLVAERGRPGSAYNISAGQAVTLQHCVDVLLGLAERPIEQCTDPSLLQDNDVNVQIGNASRLRSLTGWTPQISVDQSLADMLAYRRQEGRG